jgi:regulator of sigma E protease
MGPVMNLVLAVVVMAVVLYQGAQVPLYEQQPVVIGTFATTSVAAKAGLKAGDRIVTVDGKPIDNWEQFAMAIVPKAKRAVELGSRATAAVQVTSSRGQGKYELGDIGVQPLCIPRSRAQPESPPEAGCRRPSSCAAAPSRTLARALIERSKRSENKPCRQSRAAARADLRHAAENRGTVMIGAHIRRSRPHGRPARWKREAVVQKNWVDDADRQTLAGCSPGETSVKQLMGPVAIADLSGARAGRLDLALQPDGDDQPEPRAAQPDADPRCSDGGHIFILALEGLARRDFSMRGEGEDAARRLRAPVDADGHGHLQRLDAHSMDRKNWFPGASRRASSALSALLPLLSLRGPAT